MMKKSTLWTIAIVVVLGGSGFFALQPFPRPFDSKIWQTSSDHSVRYAMKTDLLKQHSVIGMTREQLINLLGKPDGASQTELSWDLGHHFGADDSAIDFKIVDGKVNSVDTWEH